MTVLTGSFGRGFRLQGGDAPDDQEVLRRLLAKKAGKTIDDVMDDVVAAGLEDDLFKALTCAMDRAEAEKRRREDAQAEEVA